LGRLIIIDSGRAAARPYIRLERIFRTCNPQLGTALLNAGVISKAKIGSFLAKRNWLQNRLLPKAALRPGMFFPALRPPMLFDALRLIPFFPTT